MAELERMRHLAEQEALVVERRAIMAERIASHAGKDNKIDVRVIFNREDYPGHCLLVVAGEKVEYQVPLREILGGLLELDDLVKELGVSVRFTR